MTDVELNGPDWSISLAARTYSNMLKRKYRRVHPRETEEKKKLKQIRSRPQAVTP